MSYKNLYFLSDSETHFPERSKNNYRVKNPFDLLIDRANASIRFQFPLVFLFHFFVSNLANLGGLNLRPRLSLKQALPEDPEEEECRPWRKKLLFFSPHSITMGFKVSWVSFLKISLLLLLISGIVVACFTLPIEKVGFCLLGPFLSPWIFL